MTARLRVRAFEPGDRPSLRHLYQASRDAAFVWAPPRSHALLDFDAHTHQERILVALIDGLPVGFASIWEADNFLHNLFIDPAHCRRGVGKALLARCVAHFTGVGTLKCLQANAHAIAFYVSQGWQVVSEGASPDGPYFLMTNAPAR